MNVFRVSYINEPPIRELEIFGEITYDSPVMRMLWIRTEVGIETLQKIQNVTKVEIDTKPEITRTRYYM